MLNLILLVLAFVLCLLGAFWPIPPAGGFSRPHLGWLGMACYFLSLLLTRH